MKLKEKLAEEYADPLCPDLAQFPYSPYRMLHLEKAFLAGFEKAREMAVVVLESTVQLEYNAYEALAEIKILGEEEV